MPLQLNNEILHLKDGSMFQSTQVYRNHKIILHLPMHRNVFMQGDHALRQPLQHQWVLWAGSALHMVSIARLTQQSIALTSRHGQTQSRSQLFHVYVARALLFMLCMEAVAIAVSSMSHSTTARASFFYIGAANWKRKQPANCWKILNVNYTTESMNTIYHYYYYYCCFYYYLC